MHFATAFIPSLHSKISLPDDHSHSYKNLTTMRKMGLFDGIMKAFENEEVCVDAICSTYFFSCIWLWFKSLPALILLHMIS